jgi:hypothetical protein
VYLARASASSSARTTWKLKPPPRSTTIETNEF